MGRKVGRQFFSNSHGRRYRDQEEREGQHGKGQVRLPVFPFAQAPNDHNRTNGGEDPRELRDDYRKYPETKRRSDEDTEQRRKEKYKIQNQPHHNNTSLEFMLYVRNRKANRIYALIGLFLIEMVE